MFSFFKRWFAVSDTEKHIKSYDWLLDEIKENNEALISSNPNYTRIFNEMKVNAGLEDETIEFSLYAINPAASIFREKEDGSFERHLTIRMTCNSQEHFYKGSLRHELEHIKTGLALMNKIGLDAYVSLQREVDPIASISFKTISEFMSWKAACDMDEIEKSNLTLWSVWKNTRYNLTEFCDVVAAHIAYDCVHGIMECRDERFSEKSWTCIQKIGDIIKKAALDWPLPIEKFHVLGEEINNSLSDISELR